MIFTEEQIKRLPGSTVLLRDGKRVVVESNVRRVGCYSWSMAVDDQEVKWAYADTLAGAATKSPRDIIEVLEWADGKQPEPAPIVINGTPVEVGDIWMDSTRKKMRVSRIRDDGHYPIEFSVVNFSRSGWWLYENDGNKECRHLVHCIEKGGKPYPPPIDSVANLTSPNLGKAIIGTSPEMSRIITGRLSGTALIPPLMSIWNDGPSEERPLEVGMVFEGRAVEADAGPNYSGARPISWEIPLDKTGQANLPGEQKLGRYGRSFRTEIRIVEELTDPEEYAKYLNKKRDHDQKRELKEMRKAARLGLPDPSNECEMPF